MISSSAYTELHCHSHCPLLDGAASSEALVQRAFELGMDSLALTDLDAVYGAVSFARTAKLCGLQSIFGAELTLILEDRKKWKLPKAGRISRQLEEDRSVEAHLTLLVVNETGWRNLCSLIGRARQNAPKGQAALPLADLEGRTAGLIALSGCRQGEIPAALLRGDWKAAWAAGRRYRDLFGPDNFFVELQRHHLPDEDVLIDKLDTLGQRLGVGRVATATAAASFGLDVCAHALP